MVLGERMVRAVDGTLAVVLPTVMATNPAAFHTRRYLAQRFHIDTIVSSHDPGRIYFSENTSIGEVLIICRRWKGTAPKPQTRVVNLARNPATPLDATSVADGLTAQGTSKNRLRRTSPFSKWTLIASGVGTGSP